MGLDFTISEITSNGLDSKGRHTYVTTELDNFGHSGYKMMDYGLGAQGKLYNSILWQYSIY